MDQALLGLQNDLFSSPEALLIYSLTKIHHNPSQSPKKRDQFWTHLSIPTHEYKMKDRQWPGLICIPSSLIKASDAIFVPPPFLFLL